MATTNLIIAILSDTLWLTKRRGKLRAYIDPNAGGVVWQIAAPLIALIGASLLYFKRVARNAVARFAANLREKHAFLIAALSVIGAGVADIAIRGASVETGLPLMIATMATAAAYGRGPGTVAAAVSVIAISWDSRPCFDSSRYFVRILSVGAALASGLLLRRILKARRARQE
jgi:hypothetical protein